MVKIVRVSVAILKSHTSLRCTVFNTAAKKLYAARLHSVAVDGLGVVIIYYDTNGNVLTSSLKS